MCVGVGECMCMCVYACVCVGGLGVCVWVGGWRAGTAGQEDDW